MGLAPPAPPDKGRLLDRRPAAGSRSAPTADVSAEAAAFADSTIDVGALFQKACLVPHRHMFHSEYLLDSRFPARCL